MRASAPSALPARRWWLFDAAHGPSAGIVAALGLAVCAPLALIPAVASEHGPTLCPSRALTGVPCPGCGMVRATTYLLHGDLATAWHFNPFALVVLAFLAYLVVRCAARLARGKPMRALVQELDLRVVVPVAVLWLGWGLVRIVMTATGAWPSIV